jgi:hypothetical protein
MGWKLSLPPVRVLKIVSMRKTFKKTFLQDPNIPSFVKGRPYRGPGAISIPLNGAKYPPAKTLRL